MSKQEKDYMKAVAAIGCIACRKKGLPDAPCELHHPRYNAGLAQKGSNMEVVGLCVGHHRIGPESIHGSPKRFKELFGTEQELIKETQQLVEQWRNSFV